MIRKALTFFACAATLLAATNAQTPTSEFFAVGLNLWSIDQQGNQRVIRRHNGTSWSQPFATGNYYSILAGFGNKPWFFRQGTPPNITQAGILTPQGVPATSWSLSQLSLQGKQFTPYDHGKVPGTNIVLGQVRSNGGPTSSFFAVLDTQSQTLTVSAQAAPGWLAVIDSRMAIQYTYANAQIEEISFTTGSAPSWSVVSQLPAVPASAALIPEAARGPLIGAPGTGKFFFYDGVLGIGEYYKGANGQWNYVNHPLNGPLSGWVAHPSEIGPVNINGNMFAVTVKNASSSYGVALREYKNGSWNWVGSPIQLPTSAGGFSQRRNMTGYSLQNVMSIFVLGADSKFYRASKGVSAPAGAWTGFSAL